MEIQLPRTLFDRYPYVRALGVGGMGAVYLDQQASLKRQVPIAMELKVLPFGREAGRPGVGLFELVVEDR